MYEDIRLPVEIRSAARYLSMICFLKNYKRYKKVERMGRKNEDY